MGEAFAAKTTALLALACIIAEVCDDGHLTIMKFTTNWKVGFGTPIDREAIEKMATGETLDDALRNAILTLKRLQFESDGIRILGDL